LTRQGFQHKKLSHQLFAQDSQSVYLNDNASVEAILYEKKNRYFFFLLFSEQLVSINALLSDSHILLEFLGGSGQEADFFS
jgi:hypothetical protein